MTFFTVDKLPSTEMLPGVTRRAVYLDNVMLTFFDFEPGQGRHSRRTHRRRRRLAPGAGGIQVDVRSKV
jgi:hypothetical protein